MDKSAPLHVTTSGSESASPWESIPIQLKTARHRAVPEPILLLALPVALAVPGQPSSSPSL